MALRLIRQSRTFTPAAMKMHATTSSTTDPKRLVESGANSSPTAPTDKDNPDASAHLNQPSREKSTRSERVKLFETGCSGFSVLRGPPRWVG